jgi:hypothetical protein
MLGEHMIEHCAHTGPWRRLHRTTQMPLQIVREGNASHSICPGCHCEK